TLELMEAVEYLEKNNAKEALRMVHFHIGSQIPDIRSIKKATREATRYYAKLRKLGFDKLDYIDVGGGLGVDYDGSRTEFHSSTNSRSRKNHKTHSTLGSWIFKQRRRSRRSTGPSSRRFRTITLTGLLPRNLRKRYRRKSRN